MATWRKACSRLRDSEQAAEVHGAHARLRSAYLAHSGGGGGGGGGKAAGDEGAFAVVWDESASCYLTGYAAVDRLLHPPPQDAAPTPARARSRAGLSHSQSSPQLALPRTWAPSPAVAGGELRGCGSVHMLLAAAPAAAPPPAATAPGLHPRPSTAAARTPDRLSYCRRWSCYSLTPPLTPSPIPITGPNPTPNPTPNITRWSCYSVLAPPSS